MASSRISRRSSSAGSPAVADAAQRAEPADSIASTVRDVLRTLLRQIDAHEGPGLRGGDGAEIEEILLDLDLDRSRYLLVRLPSTEHVRACCLSPREHEIARMVADGLPSKTIASVLNISSWTVGTHVRRIFAKLGVNTRAAMVAKLGEIGIGTRRAASTPTSAPVRNDASQLGSELVRRPRMTV